MCSKVEILDNEKRNAIPSWQGYHYQAKTAVLKILEYISNAHENKNEDIESIYILIEYIEDFVIFHNNYIKELYQAKKTLTKKEYFSVLTNFLFQFKIINSEACKWILIYDADNSDKDEKISKEDFKVIEKNLEGIKNELELLKNNNVEFWKENLRLTNKTSKVKQIRGFIRKKMTLKNTKMFNKLNETLKNQFIEDELDKFITLLESRDVDYDMFEQSVIFEKSEISDLDEKIESLIENLINNGFINTINKYNYSKIREHLEAKIYINLMEIKNKSEEHLKTDYNNIKEIIEGKISSFEDFEKKLMESNEKILEEIEVLCIECLPTGRKTTKCSECAIWRSLDLNYKEVIKTSNLDFPKVSPEKINQDMLETILSRDRRNNLVDILFEFKDDLSFKMEKNHIVFEFIEKNLFVSQVLEKGFRVKKYISENAGEYLEIYNEYDEILTRNYSGDININSNQLLMTEDDYNGEQKNEEPKFNDILPVKCINSDELNTYIFEKNIKIKDIKKGDEDK